MSRQGAPSFIYQESGTSQTDESRWHAQYCDFGGGAGCFPGVELPCAGVGAADAGPAGDGRRKGAIFAWGDSLVSGAGDRGSTIGGYKAKNKLGSLISLY